MSRAVARARRSRHSVHGWSDGARLVLVGGAVVLVAWLATAGAVSAEEPPPGVGLTEAVAAVPSTSPTLDAAESERAAVGGQITEDTAELASAGSELVSLAAQQLALAELIARRDGQIARTASQLQRTDAAVRSVSTDWFVRGSFALDGLDPALTADERAELSRQRVFAQVGAQDVVDQRRHTAQRLASLTDERNAFEAERAAAERRSTELTGRRAALEASLAAAAARIPGLDEEIRIAKMTATIDGTDLSATSLDAYWRAAQSVALSDPTCGVTWPALAGIGRTESMHGTYRGAVLGVDGVVAPPIYGPDLDGSNSFAVIGDSDGGALDGTARTDRAVGPMQFLPSTWDIVGSDGNADGVADPQNLFDAALSAAVYLCRSGPGLGDDATMRKALLTYNNSGEYVAVVSERAMQYATVVPLG